MQPNEMKEVRFDLYCHRCEYISCSEHEEPCDTCLTEETNLYSEKPVCFKEAK